MPHKGRPNTLLTTPSPIPTPPLRGPHRLRCQPASVTCGPKGGQDGATQARCERLGHGNSGEAAIAEKGPGPHCPRAANSAAGWMITAGPPMFVPHSLSIHGQRGWQPVSCSLLTVGAGVYGCPGLWHPSPLWRRGPPITSPAASRGWLGTANTMGLGEGEERCPKNGSSLVPGSEERYAPGLTWGRAPAFPPGGACSPPPSSAGTRTIL